MSFHKDGMHYITEVNPKRGRPYFLVRAPMSRTEYKTSNNTFSFNEEEGSRDSALDRAQKKRDDIVIETFGTASQVNVGIRPKIVVNKRASHNSKSGVVGVCKCYESTKKGRNYSYWVAVWQEGPVGGRTPHRKAYSVGKHGEDEAFKMALEKRREMVELHSV